LYDRYGGFLNKDEYTLDFVNYARLMFERLGSKVKYWITYNEPWCTTGESGGETGSGGGGACRMLTTRQFSDTAPAISLQVCGRRRMASGMKPADMNHPGHTSDRSISEIGDSSTEPWLVAHHILIAHATAVKLYRDEFQAQQQGVIGITLNGDWTEPWDPADSEDIEACERKLEFSIAWFGDPIYRGEYPASKRVV
jgi:beta-glucosidase